MTASLFYRIAAVLLLLFAAAHTLGFNQTDPSWGVDPLLFGMRATHFDALGSSRPLWDFFLAAGYTVGALYLFAAVLAWQLGGLTNESLARLRITRWAFALCFAGVALISWLYLFIVPVAFAAAITVCLAIAASLSAKQ